MEAEFWLNKWNKQETGFHLTQVHPLLQKFYNQVFSEDKGVFVPLCGKTSDLKLFADKGSYTLGCELSKIAVEQFYDAHKLKAEIATSEKFTHYISANLEILVGDYFELRQVDIGACQTIYDRASLVALPSKMRTQYVKKLCQLFSKADMLLITLEYPQNEMAGPPFNVDLNEVFSLFEFASVNQVYSQNILAKEPKFVERGLSYLNECAYIIRW